MILIDGKRSSRVSALDRGLAYGDGVFRTMRAELGSVVSWRRHYDKLSVDCGRIGIPCPEEEVFRRDIALLLRSEPDCIVKIIVTRGEGGRGYAIPEPSLPRRIVLSFPPPTPCREADESGVRVRWCTSRLSIQPALAGIKHLNRLENVLARREWSDPEIAEGLMLDCTGSVIEGTMSNLFILERGKLVTPVLATAGVAGVQRDRLMHLTPRLAVDCTVEALTPDRVLAAEQVYLTNSVIGLWWVSRLAQQRWQRSALTPALMHLLRHPDD